MGEEGVTVSSFRRRWVQRHRWLGLSLFYGTWVSGCCV